MTHHPLTSMGHTLDPQTPPASPHSGTLNLTSPRPDTTKMDADLAKDAAKFAPAQHRDEHSTQLRSQKKLLPKRRRMR